MVNYFINKIFIYSSIVILIIGVLVGVFWINIVYNGSFEDNVLGVSDDEILIGSSAALRGHASFLGTQTIRGSLAYINEINENGGIYGRQIKLISYNDEYDPIQTIDNTKKLIGRDQVFALFDYVGTPTSVKIIDIVNEAKIPLIGLFTGAEALRVPFRPYIFNVRDSYYTETESAIEYFTHDLGFNKIAVFYQDDAFGYAVLRGTKLALEKRGLKPVVLATYIRGSMDIEDAVQSIRKSGAEAVVMVGTYSPLAKFIKVSNDEGFYPYFHTVSFVGSEAFAEQLINVQRVNESQYKKIIVTQVVPSPLSDDFETVREYRDMMKKWYPWDDVNYVGLEGFINAKILVKAIRKTGKNLTRTGFIKALEDINDFDVGIGKSVNYGNNDHQGLDGIYYSCLCEEKTFSLFNPHEKEDINEVF